MVGLGRRMTYKYGALQDWHAPAAGEDTAFAPLLPKLFKALQTASGTPAEIGDEYVEKMRGRVPEVCPAPMTLLRCCSDTEADGKCHIA